MEKPTWLTMFILALICSWGSLPLFDTYPLIAYPMVFSSMVFYGICSAYVDVMDNKKGK